MYIRLLSISFLIVVGTKYAKVFGIMAAVCPDGLNVVEGEFPLRFTFLASEFILVLAAMIAFVNLPLDIHRYVGS